VSDDQPPELLRDQREVQLSVWVPFPLSQMLDDLCEQLGRTSAGIIRRKELIAALLFEAPRSDSRELANLVSRYRETQSWPAQFRREKPGPRTRKA
jgi:hypothetical protein